jgi:hypothetical protein
VVALAHCVTQRAHLPDHHGGDLDGVAIGIVDLGHGGLVVAWPGREPEAPGEGVDPAPATRAYRVRFTPAGVVRPRPCLHLWSAWPVALFLRPSVIACGYVSHDAIIGIVVISLSCIEELIRETVSTARAMDGWSSRFLLATR